MDIQPDTIIHRVGGGSIENLRLGPLDSTAVPPGLSVLVGGTPQDAADTMRPIFQSRKWKAMAGTVGSASVAAIRDAGFEVIEAKTNKLPNHARIVHADEIAGFNDVNLTRLSAAFQTTTGC